MLRRFVGTSPPARPASSRTMAWEWPVPKAWMTPSERTHWAISSAARVTSPPADSVMRWRAAMPSRAKPWALTDSTDTGYSPLVD